MLLIRRVDKEEHAQQINDGTFGCRDLLSHLFSQSGGSYKYVDYYERLFEQVRSDSQPNYLGINDLSERNQQILKYILDPMIVDSFMTFFHVFDPQITPQWLDEQDDHGFYFFVEPRCELGFCACGENADCYYAGAPIRYLNAPEEVSINETGLRVPALACVFANREIGCDLTQIQKATYASEMLCSYAPLFNRVLGEGTSPVENEYRYVIRTKRTIHRDLTVGNLGKHCIIKLDGRRRGIEIPTYQAIPAQANYYVLHPLDSPRECLDLIAMMREGHQIDIEMNFYDIDISATSKRWGYIGNKKDCIKFVREEVRGVKRRKETANYHFHKGPWDHLMNSAIHPWSDVAEVIALPEEGYYSLQPNAHAPSDNGVS